LLPRLSVHQINRASIVINRNYHGCPCNCTLSDKELEDLARMFNPIIQGWVNYYGRYYKSALYPTLKCLDRRLIMWATRKYKRLRNHRRRAAQWLNRIAHKQPWLFAHWRLLYAKA
jgi:RNA-directed DNA polymerase